MQVIRLSCSPWRLLGTAATLAPHSQALAESLRRQLYQAPVSKHLLASTIVSGFGDCIRDGSPGVAVSDLWYPSVLPLTPPLGIL